MCAVIVGNSTQVSTALFTDGGIISVNFGFNPQINRLWQLGSFSPYDTYVMRQRELSITAYGQREDGSGGSQQYDLTPSDSCADADPISITVTPGACEVSINPFTYDYVPSSYSYKKDNFGWGQESWSFVTKPDVDNYTGDIVILRGVATGNVLTGDGILTAAEMGVVINEADSVDGNGDNIEGESGSVQAGQNSIGEYSVSREIVVSQIGGSIGKKDAWNGSATVNIPTETVYL
jgi:hypothetical protein